MKLRLEGRDLTLNDRKLPFSEADEVAKANGYPFVEAMIEQLGRARLERGVHVHPGSKVLVMK